MQRIEYLASLCLVNRPSIPMELWGFWSVELGASLFDSVGEIVRMQSLVDRPVYRIGRAAKPNILAEDTIGRRARHDLTRLASHDHTLAAFSLFSDWRC